MTNQRRAKLTDSRKLFELYREAEEVSIWISDKVVIAASEDYGQDLEHVQVKQINVDSLFQPPEHWFSDFM